MPRKIVKSKLFFDDKFIDTIGEVSTDKYKPWESNDKLKVIGKPISRVDGYDKVSGSAIYTFDINLPRMAHAKILGSAYPNAKIKRINSKKAENLPGVLTIITSEDEPKIKWYYNTTFLFDSHVRCVGDEVACVVAETEIIAEEAIRLIEIEYEELSFVVDAKEAMKLDSPKVHDWGNILDGKPSTYSRGDIEEGFKNADIIVEDTFSTQVAIHNPTEVHCSVVNWDGDKLTVWDSTQAIFAVRDQIASSLDIPESDVRVIKKYRGRIR